MGSTINTYTDSIGWCTISVCTALDVHTYTVSMYICTKGDSPHLLGYCYDPAVVQQQARRSSSSIGTSVSVTSCCDT
jgi:hypothetical protein